MSSPDKSAVAITGASSGLGAQLARRFAGEGHSVALMARRSDRLQEVRDQCLSLGAPGAFYLEGDVTRRSDCETLVSETLDRFPALDVVVANAGRSMWARFSEISRPERFREITEVNYTGVVNTVRAALSDLRRSDGSLIVISSIQAKIGVPHHTFYAASKHAVDGFCKSLRSEIPDLHLMTVYPHWIRNTELRERSLRSEQAEEVARSPEDGVSRRRCARAVYRGLMAGRSEVYVPSYLRWVALLYALFPSLVDRFVQRKVESQQSPEEHPSH